MDLDSQEYDKLVRKHINFPFSFLSISSLQSLDNIWLPDLQVSTRRVAVWTHKHYEIASLCLSSIELYH
jgi:hypothetical protein